MALAGDSTEAVCMYLCSIIGIILQVDSGVT